jgi:hypothetical protein
MNKHILFAATACALMMQPALADTRDEVWAAMQRCQAIQDDRAWLDCTYGAKQPMRAKLGLPPVPDYQLRLVPPPAPAMASVPDTRKAAAPAGHRRGGFFQILGGTAPPVAVSTLASVLYDGQGAFVVTLQNGQVWRQMDAEMAPKVRLKVGAHVTITPGALWSYNLKTNDSPRSYKVERKT